MKRFLFAAGAFALVAAAVTFAQDTKPDQPPARRATAQLGQGKAARPVEFQPEPKGSPGGTTTTRITPAKMATLEEEFELIEAHRDVRKAHVRAAEVGVKAAEAQLRTHQQGWSEHSAVRTDEGEAGSRGRAAQLEIRIAEMKEVEVKVKYAKKRLDDAKAAGVRPAPGVRPVPVDPPPAINELPAIDVALDVTFGAVDDKVVAELKKKIEELTAATKTQKETVAKADAEAKLAVEELARILDIAMKGRVRPGTIEAAEAKAKEAKAAFEKAKEKLKETENSLEKVKAKLKELEK